MRHGWPSKRPRMLRELVLLALARNPEASPAKLDGFPLTHRRRVSHLRVRWEVPLLLTALALTAVNLNVAGLGLTAAIFNDVDPLDANAFSAADCFGRSWYLHNNPTPPTGDTNSQTDLPLDLTSPTAATLFNYDSNRDSSEGLFIGKGGAGPGETDSTKMQAWRSAAFADDQCLVGTVAVTVWAAIKDYGQGKAGEVFVYLRDHNGSTYTEIGNGSVFNADWQGGSSTFVEATINIPGLNYTLPAGNMLEVKIIVGSSAGDDMWFSYDTTSHSTRVDSPTS